MGNYLSFLWMLVQTVMALAFVCGLAYLIFRVIMPRLSAGFSSNNMVRVIDRIGLEARKNLYVIEVAGRWLLIAASESGVQLIAELDAEAAAEAERELAQIRQAPRSSPVLGKSFADKLNDVLNRKQGGK
ncbi:MAG TPA: flagellar biosynthetic protein FliO [Pyrinomonadaceae bacterium]|jgi:flagellar protein FliO/FliZ